jgi:3-phosphoshikimate 1-carboxyvinyltransferase
LNSLAELEITPCGGAVRGTIRPPGSKSLTNRALVCAALAEGPSTLTGALASNDTRVMIDALDRLGIAVEECDDGQTLVVQGAGGQIPAFEADLFIGNSGTTVRFLTALLTLGRGAFRLDGVPRMRERPIGDLADALNSLGAQVRCELENGCPPVIVHANGLPGGVATVRGDLSSQFLTALLMTAPCAMQPTTIEVAGELVSQPYVQMTLALMRTFGVEVTVDEKLTTFHVPLAKYLAREYAIEPDASAASYFWAAAAITGGEVTVEGLSRDALQGDVAFVECLAQMGCDVEYGKTSITVRGKPLHGIDIDMNAVSDTVQTLAAVTLFAQGSTRVRGVAHNRLKETDRIGNLAIELRKLGATVDEHEDGLTIYPSPLRGARIETYDDHRMAMSLALVGLKQPGVVITNPGCTAKTYPNYFVDLKRVAETGC